MHDFKLADIKNVIFDTVIDVRVSDLNYGNHLGHDALVSFFHEARVRFLKQLEYTEFDIEGLGLLVTNLVVNYVSEAFYANQVFIALSVGEVSRTSMQIIYQASHKDTHQIIARALTTITFYDYTQAKVARIPQAFLQRCNNE